MTKMLSLVNKYKDFLKFDKYRLLRKEIYLKLKNQITYDYGEGYFYQSLDKINLSGLRDTKKRIDVYDLEEFTANKKILDIGSNIGAILFEIKNNYNFAKGIEYNKNLVEISNKINEKLKIKNIEFICEDFLNYNFLETFDMILSLANHHTFDKGISSINDYLKKIDNILDKGGILVFESHHPNYEPAEVFNKLKNLLVDEFNYILIKEKVLEFQNFYDMNRTVLYFLKK
tara:strand:+ start:191 stop:880 length:690 start_codon:yes stop_codon:yes gene_type:complete